ncbi:arsenate reductase (glutaredoxin) [Caulobacter sp. LARHSG274]
MTRADFPVTIFHNPSCGTSRNVVAMVREAGLEPTVVEYLKAGWTREQLLDLLAQAGATPRDWLRDKGTSAAELGLLEPGVADDAILEAMVAHPILVNRPIVVTPKGVALCRPSERALDLLDAVPESFTKEDGEVVRPRG